MRGYSRNARRFPEVKNQDRRTPAQLDRDRILYSLAFARLAEVTQVVPSYRGHGFHNRLTHSLKVAQLSRRIAEKLKRSNRSLVESIGGICEDAAEAAGLAHDLGHPPFGHAAEQELNRLAVLAGCTDGFEGNAQSFRIVTRLAVGDAVSEKSPPYDAIEGLNLTRATLNGVLKYPWMCGTNPDNGRKWGAYEEDRTSFLWVRKQQPRPQFIKSVEAEIMDWADDITFAVHDLFDFFRAGLIPLDRIADSVFKASHEAQGFLEAVFENNEHLRTRKARIEKAFELLVAKHLLAFVRPYHDRFADQIWIWRSMTGLITEFVDAISLRKPDESNPSVVVIDRDIRDKVDILKQLTWHYVILKDDLNSEQAGQIRMIRTLFHHFRKASLKEITWRFFPSAFRDDLEQRRDAPRESIVRVVVDCIASMTEAELLRQYRLVSGLH
jgi:dGTPase